MYAILLPTDLLPPSSSFKPKLQIRSVHTPKAPSQLFLPTHSHHLLLTSPINMYQAPMETTSLSYCPSLPANTPHPPSIA